MKENVANDFIMKKTNLFCCLLLTHKALSYFCIPHTLWNVLILPTATLRAESTKFLFALIWISIRYWLAYNNFTIRHRIIKPRCENKNEYVCAIFQILRNKILQISKKFESSFRIETELEFVYLLFRLSISQSLSTKLMKQTQ